MVRLSSQLREKDHVIWDWNGTLLNDVDLCVRVINGILTTHSLPLLTRETYRSNFRFPIIEYYRTLGFDFSKVPFETVAMQFINSYNPQAIHCSLFDGARELLEAIGVAKKKQSILSAAHQSHLDELTRHHRIESHFVNICGLGDHYAGGKIERGKELLKKLDTPKSRCVLIGDTDHDVEVAHELGIDVVVLADGHQDLERLRKVHPNPVINRYELPW